MGRIEIDEHSILDGDYCDQDVIDLLGYAKQMENNIKRYHAGFAGMLLDKNNNLAPHHKAWLLEAIGYKSDEELKLIVTQGS